MTTLPIIMVLSFRMESAPVRSLRTRILKFHTEMMGRGDLEPKTSSYAGGGRRHRLARLLCLLLIGS